MSQGVENKDSATDMQSRILEALVGVEVALVLAFELEVGVEVDKIRLCMSVAESGSVIATSEAASTTDRKSNTITSAPN
jgi:hypothetical protein